jgi:hypothetical protein
MSSGRSQASGSALSLSSKLPPRHPDPLEHEQASVASSGPPKAFNRSKQTAHKDPPPSQGFDDPFNELEAKNPGFVDTKDVQEVEAFSSNPAFEWKETALPEHTYKREFTFSATSDLNYSADGDSLLQYSSTNGTSSYSQQSSPMTPISPVSPSQSSVEQQAEEWGKLKDDAFETNWTSFGDSPFHDDAFHNDDGFNSFLPFESDSVPDNKTNSSSNSGEVDPAWDTSQAGVYNLSPDSPSSVFNFLPQQDSGITKSKSEIIWDVTDSDLDFSQAPSNISAKFSI